MRGLGGMDGGALCCALFSSVCVAHPDPDRAAAAAAAAVCVRVLREPPRCACDMTDLTLAAFNFSNTNTAGCFYICAAITYTCSTCVT